jgi:uncharacterized membrane protein YGL010W
MKGKKKVDGEVGLIFIAYLFTRMKNILGLNGLKEAIEALFSIFYTIFYTRLQVQIPLIRFQGSLCKNYDYTSVVYK